MGVEFVVMGWRKSDRYRQVGFLALQIGSLGLLYLLCFSFPILETYISTILSSPEEAEFVVLSSDGVTSAVPVSHLRKKLIVMEFKCVRYLASKDSKYKFVRVRDVPCDFVRFLDPRYNLQHSSEELKDEQSCLQFVYGNNVMTIPESTFLDILIRHMLSPFYLFQYFAASVWFAEDYWLYASLILLITFGAIFFTTQESLNNLKSLRRLAASNATVQAISDTFDRPTTDVEHGEMVELMSDRFLLPGKKFKVTSGMSLPCDCILLSGKVVVDESMLTGETVPVSKVPIQSSDIDGDRTSFLTSSDPHGIVLSTSVKSEEEQAELLPGRISDDSLATKRPGSVLFGGTRIQVCFGKECIVVVYRTGFRSAKGALVASLLQPKGGFIHFISDALWVLAFMLLLSTVLYIIVSPRILLLGASGADLFFHYLDAITIAVPPALTCCLTVATAISVTRLKKLGIFVSDTSRVNFAGVTSAVCFDKTGTLTEERLSFLGYQTPAISSRLGVSSDEWLDFNVQQGQILPLRCQEIMATCHALSLFGFADVVAPVGDPLEVELLSASGWELDRDDDSEALSARPPADHLAPINDSQREDEYRILKHFEFTPDRLRAASIVREPSGHIVYVMKGSPEVIVRLCSAATVPTSIYRRLARLAKRGYRVIAIAYRDLTGRSETAALKLTQDECEDPNHSQIGQHIVFAGLLYLSNELKSSARRTVRALHHAQLHTNMITGDHVYTAIAIARQCGILHSIIKSPPATESTTTAATNKKNALSTVDDDIATNINNNGNNNTSGAVVEPRVLILDESDSHPGQISILDFQTGSVVDVTLSHLAMYATRSVILRVLSQHQPHLWRQEVLRGCAPQSADDADDNNDDNDASSEETMNPLLKEKDLRRLRTASAPVISPGKRTRGFSNVSLISGSSNTSTTQNSRHAELPYQLFQPVNTHADPSSTVAPSSASSPVQVSGSNGMPMHTHHVSSSSNAAAPALTLSVDCFVELAMTGRALQLLCNQCPEALVLRLLRCTRVFARAKPHDKCTIVKRLQQIPEMSRPDVRQLRRILKQKHKQQQQQRQQLQQQRLKQKQKQRAKSRSRSKGSYVPLEDNDTTTDNNNNNSNFNNNNDDEDISTAITSHHQHHQHQQHKHQSDWTLRISRLLAGGEAVDLDPMDVIFCGDGANDMIALRAATVGISLCDAETSVAAPITSREATPYAVIDVLREGRCSLVTAYVLILFNIMYGTIQLFMVCSLYFFGLIPGNYMYLQQDLGYTLFLGLAISYDLPSRRLSSQLPPRRFLSRYFLLHLIIMLLSFICFQIIALWLLSGQTFYQPYVASDAFIETYSHEASTAQAMALGQLMIAALVSSIGPPFRTAWPQNRALLMTLAVQSAWLCFQLCAPNNYFLRVILQLRPLPLFFAFIVIALLVLNLMTCLLLTGFFHEHVLPMTNQRWFELRSEALRRSKDTSQHPHAEAGSKANVETTTTI